jgi:hypothetical protein
MKGMKDLYILHDNAPEHKGAAVIDFFRESLKTRTPNSQYSAPFDLFLFPRLKKEQHLAGYCYKLLRYT